MVLPWDLPPWFFFSSDEVPAVTLVSAGRVGKELHVLALMPGLQRTA